MRRMVTSFFRIALQYVNNRGNWRQKSLRPRRDPVLPVDLVPQGQATLISYQSGSDFLPLVEVQETITLPQNTLGGKPKHCFDLSHDIYFID